MRPLVCGGRNYGLYLPYKDPQSRAWIAAAERRTVTEVLDEIAAENEIEYLISGHAAGADTLAEEWALARGIHVKAWAADWNSHGRAAGPIRNERMLRESNATHGIAFPGGNGTADMVGRLREAGLPVMEVTTRRGSPGLYTIGASNQPLESLLLHLANFQIEVVVDVRSKPFSKWAHWFNQSKELEKAFAKNGQMYMWLGGEMGGKPEDARYYDERGHVLYGLRALAPDFCKGIERLTTGISKYRVAVMCAEEPPEECHRRRLIGRVMFDKVKVPLCHIRGTGKLVTEEELRERDGVQPSLFEAGSTWRSKKPVKH